MITTSKNKVQSRRDFVRGVLRGVLLAAFAGFGGAVIMKRRCDLHGWRKDGNGCGNCPDLAKCDLPQASSSRSVNKRRTVWQLDPAKCIQCGRCATNCVLQDSAVKCVHHFEMCGYCKLCFGFFQPGSQVLTSAAENQICPTGAICRKYLEEPYYEYTIDESLCVGCGRCVKTCAAFGNGSLILQVRHDRCVNCNDCSIARECPADAFRRFPAETPYLLKQNKGLA